MTNRAHSHAADAVVHPPSISLAELVPWLLFAAALVALVGLVSFADGDFVHEFFHDGRHLMAFPCH